MCVLFLFLHLACLHTCLHTCLQSCLHACPATRIHARMHAYACTHARTIVFCYCCGLLVWWRRHGCGPQSTSCRQRTTVFCLTPPGYPRLPHMRALSTGWSTGCAEHLGCGGCTATGSEFISLDHKAHSSVPGRAACAFLQVRPPTCMRACRLARLHALAFAFMPACPPSCLTSRSSTGALAFLTACAPGCSATRTPAYTFAHLHAHPHARTHACASSR